MYNVHAGTAHFKRYPTVFICRSEEDSSLKKYLTVFQPFVIQITYLTLPLFPYIKTLFYTSKNDKFLS